MAFQDYLETQPLLRVVTALALGILIGDRVSELLPLWVWIIAVVACLVIELLLKNHPYNQSIFVLLAVFFAGIASICKTNQDLLDPFRADIPINYEAVITSEPQVKGKVLRCDMSIVSVGGESVNSPIPVKAAVLLDTLNNVWRHLQLGSGIKAQSVMQPLSNYRYDSNFDYVRWLHCHGFRAQTFIYYSDWSLERVSLAALSRMDRLKLKAMAFRHKLIDYLHQIGNKHLDNKDKDDQQSAVVAAMVLGDKHALDKKTKDDYSVSGASHVLALSGLHLSIIYTVLTLLFGKGYKRRWLSQSLIIISVWIYVILVGMSTSVIRSAVMLSVYSLCLVSGRDKASVNSLSLAALIMLVSNPLSLWDIGFQMSFMAVLSILVFYRKVYGLVPKDCDLTNFPFVNRLIKMLWSTAAVSISAQIGTAPLVAFYFERFSCYFMLTNYIVIPCASLIIYGALVVLLSAPLPAVSAFFASILGGISMFLNSSVSFIATLPGASIDNIHLEIAQVVGFYLLIAIFCIIYSYLIKLRKLKKLDVFR